MPFTRQGKWYPDPATRPDRRHTNNLVSALRTERERTMDEQKRWFESLLSDLEESDDETN